MSPAPRLPNVTIRASAGAGKTYRLTNRYLELLAAKEAPDRILATTFTRKAAGEILQRILQRLAAAAADPAACAELAGEIGAARLRPEGARDLLVAVLRRLHRLRVCTLDSFFLQIAGCFSLDLGLPPDWTVVEDEADQAMRAAAVRELIRTRPPAELLDRVRRLARGGLRRSVTEQVARIARDLHETWLDTAETPEVWAVPPGPPAPPPEAVESAVGALARLKAPLTKKGEPNLTWSKALEAGLESARKRDWAGFLAKGIGANLSAGGAKYSGIPIPDDVRAAYAALLPAAAAVLRAELSDRTIGARDLLADFDRCRRDLQRRRGGLRFGDVTRHLAGAAAHQRLDDVYYRLDAKIAHLLLDEFQDTSVPQWRVLDPFAEEVVAHADGSRSFFCVGDVKQAIYGWRGGVAEIFDHLHERFPGVERSEMTRTRRSAPPVVDAVNAVFETLAANAVLVPGPGDADDPAHVDLRPAAETWAAGFSRHETERTDRPGHVRMIVAPLEPDGEADPVRFAAREAARLAAEAPRAVIGVLVRRNRTVARLIYELRRLGADASEEGGSPPTDSPPVAAVLSLLALADHPGDTAARFHVARSPLGPAVGLGPEATDEDAAALAWRVRRRLVEEGYGAVLAGWARALAPVCDVRDRHRLEKLAGEARRFDADAGPRTDAFRAFVRSLRVEDPTPARIRVMTVHQAKGLEFDVVLLPELDGRLHEAHREPVLVAREAPAAPVRAACVGVTEATRRLCPDVQELYAGTARRLTREGFSVLYVALTRAIHALHLIVPPAPKKAKDGDPPPQTFAGLLRAALAPGRGGEAGEVLYEHGDPAWAEVRSPKSEVQSPKSTPTTPTLKLGTWNLELGTGAGAPGRRSRILPRRSPAALAGGDRVDLANRLRLAGRASRARGVLLHAFFQRIEWLEGEGPSDEDLTAAAHRCGLGDSETAAAIREFRGLLARPGVRSALARDPSAGDAVEVWRERPFAVRDGDTILTGAFDRVVLKHAPSGLVVSEVEPVEGSRDGRIEAAEVTDFKTDAVEAGDAARLDALTEHYRPQLEAYRRAAAKLTGLEPAKVRAGILFVGAGERREV